MSAGVLNFRGWISDTSGFYPTGKETHNAPERDVTTYQIPGRNGDLAIDNGRYTNITISYPCFTVNLSAYEQKIRTRFGSTFPEYGIYGQLRDSYDTTHYRLARPVGGISFEPVRPNAANFELSFDCDPRRFLDVGDDVTEIVGGYDNSLENPTWFTAKPIIDIEGVVNGTKIELADSSTGKVYTMTATTSYADVAEIDSETQNIYDPDTGDNLNYLFTLSDGFPEIGYEGQVTITITGTYTSAFIVPKWWEL